MKKQTLYEYFTKRELRLMLNCLEYAERGPAGLYRHNIMLLVARMSHFLEFGDAEQVRGYIDNYPE